MAKVKTPPIGRPYDYTTKKAVASEIDRFVDPSSAELQQQAHLTWLGNMSAVWKEFTGKGVHVGVYDEGVQKSHWDLDGNYDASRHVVVTGEVLDGQPVGNAPHGTAVAGLIAAERNGRGGVGVAYDAGVTGVDVFNSTASVNFSRAGYIEAMLQAASRFDVTNHSYGEGWDFFSYLTSHFDRLREGTSGWQIGQVLEHVATFGRGGLGTTSVFSAANSGHDGQYTSAGGRHSVMVAAFRQNDGHSSAYSNYGSHLLVSAASNDFAYLYGEGQVTTDLLGTDGYNMSPDHNAATDYTNQFGGTSGAAPIVTGVVALMLDANENLGWRDVKNILAASAKMPLPFDTGPTAIDIMVGDERRPFLLNNSQFRLGGEAGNWNGGAMHYSTDYGYGAVDAYSAVRMAEVWGLFHASQTSANEVQTGGVYDVGMTVSGSNTENVSDQRIDFEKEFLTDPAAFTFTVDDNVALEHLDLQLDYTQLNRSVTEALGRDVTNTGTLFLAQFKLTAPDGTEAFVGQNGALATINDDEGALPLDLEGTTFTLSFANLRGVESKGEWKLEFAVSNVYSDDVDGEGTSGALFQSLTINSIRVDMYGSAVTNDDVYTYTNEFFDMLAIRGEGARKTLNDTDGGTDWINAAAVSSDIALSLVGGQSTSFDGDKAFTIGRTSVIEGAVTGDGDDTLIGNRFDNSLFAMRGNDRLNGGAGNDILFGGTGSDSFLFDNRGTSGKDTVLDLSRGDMIATQTALRGQSSNGTITVAKNAMLLLDGLLSGDTLTLSQNAGAVLKAQGQKDGYFWYAYVSGSDLKPGDVIREVSFQPERLATGSIDALLSTGGSAGSPVGMGTALAGPMGDHGAFYLYDSFAGTMSGGVLLDA